MSLKPEAISPVPEQTARIAKAAFTLNCRKSYARIAILDLAAG